MIFQVISDLKVFLLFYGILIIMFGMIFAIIGVGNGILDGAFKELLEMEDPDEEIPNQEYDLIPPILGYVF